MKNFLAAAVLAASVVATSPAHAAIIDFSTSVAIDQPSLEKMLAGEALNDKDTTQSLGKLARFALMANYPDEAQSLPPATKQARFELAVRLINDPKLDLSLDDLKLIRDIIGKAYGTLVVGQTSRLLDSKPIVDKR